MRLKPFIFPLIVLICIVAITFVTGKDRTFVNSVGMKFAFIPKGSFMMGSARSAADTAEMYGGTEADFAHEHPQHRVTISRSFHMQLSEVTQKQWETVMGDNPSRFKGDNRPVERVSWNDAQEFIRKLNQLEGADKYRLPTEAEWEYACRAKTRKSFYTGSCIYADQANYNGNYPGKSCSKGRYEGETLPVISFTPNPWGLYDMHGNVWEWCQDWYGGYSPEDSTDPQGPLSGSYRVLRGGSWDLGAWNARSAYRFKKEPDARDSSFGFRVVCVSDTGKR